MIFIITIITLVLFAVLVGYTWHRLDSIEKHFKIIYILLGLVIVSIITLVIFNISSIGIEYEEIEIKNDIRTMLVLVFMPLNGLFIMPAFAKIITKINEKDIEKNELIYRSIIILTIFILVLVIECKYMKTTQLGIMQIYQKLK